MTKSRKILCTLLALWMSASVVPGQTLADDTVPVDFAETEPARDPVTDMLPEDLADVAPDAVAPSDTIAAADGVIASGTCGDNLTWVLDDAGTLTISGEGEMMDFTDEDAPWSKYLYTIIAIGNGGSYVESSGIKEVVVEEGITSIGAYAFTKKNKPFYYTTATTIEQTLAEINNAHPRMNEEYASNEITSLQLPSTLVKINAHALENCINLSEITIPKSVLSIPYGTFQTCDTLRNIYVDAENTTYCDIDGILYHRNAKMEIDELLLVPLYNQVSTLELPNTLQYVADNAITDVYYLKNVVFPDRSNDIGLWIGANAFHGCRNIGEIHLPEYLRSISSSFAQCYALKEITISENNAYYCVDEQGVLYNKAKTILMRCPPLSGITSYSIPDTVTTIQDHAFQLVSTLTDITIPEHIDRINDSVFSGCQFQEIHIPDAVTYIGESAFSGCSSLTHVSIPDAVTSIKDYTFNRCSNLKTVVLSSNLTSIGDYAFNKCTALEAISLPDTVETLGFQAFRECTNLQSIPLSSSLKELPVQAFFGCVSLQEVYIPDSVTRLGLNTFAGCTSLEKVRLPQLLTEISDQLFSHCTSLHSIEIPKSVNKIGYCAFSDCTALTAMHIPENVFKISGGAFENCTNLTSLYFYGDAPTVESTTFCNTFPTDTTLYYIEGKSGWTSPTWTASNGVTYNTATFVPETTTVPGDIDGNGVLDYFDVSTLYTAYLSGEVDPATMDVNTDGVVDYFDVAKLYAAFRGTVSLGE